MAYDPFPPPLTEQGRLLPIPDDDYGQPREWTIAEQRQYADEVEASAPGAPGDVTSEMRDADAPPFSVSESMGRAEIVSPPIAEPRAGRADPRISEARERTAEASIAEPRTRQAQATVSEPTERRAGATTAEPMERPSPPASISEPTQTTGPGGERSGSGDGGSLSDVMVKQDELLREIREVRMSVEEAIEKIRNLEEGAGRL